MNVVLPSFCTAVVHTKQGYKHNMINEFFEFKSNSLLHTVKHLFKCNYASRLEEHKCT